LFFADPADLSLRDEGHAFLLGGDVLVQPRLLKEERDNLPMPAGKWRPFALAGEDPASEIDHPILRLREGAIIPLGHGGQTTRDAFEGPLTLLVSLDALGRASGDLYEDAGEGFGYRDGDYLLTTYQAVLSGGRVEVSVAREEGDRPRSVRELHVQLLTSTAVLRASGIDGESLLVQF
jgi:alpha-glucosidase